jgi:hypothetical protein
LRPGGRPDTVAALPDLGERSPRSSGVGAAPWLLLLPVAVALGLGALAPGRADWGRLLLAGALWGLGAWIAYRTARYALRGGLGELLLAAAGLALALLMGELLLRTLRPYESLPRFRWIASRRYHHINPPLGRMFSGFVGGAPILVETNEDGLRTRHSRAEFLEHRVRIAVLGDSFVFGPGVDEAQSFPAQLEKRLRQGSTDAAVLNAGVISYSPLLEERLFEGVVREYRPTLVLLLLDVTDIGDDSIYASKATADGPEPFALEGESRIAFHGALYQLVEPWLLWLGAQAAYPVTLARTALGTAAPVVSPNYYLNYVSFEGKAENRYFIYRHPLAETEPFFRETFRHVEDIASKVEASGAGFVLVIVPRYHHWSEKECPRNWELGAYGTSEPYQYEYFRFFDERRAASRFPIYDLLPPFRQAKEFPLVFPNDPHWNPAGHAFVARTIQEYLAGAGLIPTPGGPG